MPEVKRLKKYMKRLLDRGCFLDLPTDGNHLFIALCIKIDLLQYNFKYDLWCCLHVNVWVFPDAPVSGKDRRVSGLIGHRKFSLVYGWAMESGESFWGYGEKGINVQLV